MAREIVGDTMRIEENTLIPIRPAFDSFKVPYVNDPTSFMMYGENALKEYNAEVKRVEAELRREVYGQQDVVTLEKKHKKANACSILSLIFGLLILALLVVGKFLTIEAMPTLFVIAESYDGLTYVMNAVNGLTSGAQLDIMALLPVIGIAVTALFTLITMITGLIRVRKAGTGAGMKICLFLSFVGAILTAAYLLATGKTIEIGLYIIIGLTFISTLIGFCSKSAKRINKAE